MTPLDIALTWRLAKLPCIRFRLPAADRGSASAPKLPRASSDTDQSLGFGSGSGTRTRSSTALPCLSLYFSGRSGSKQVEHISGHTPLVQKKVQVRVMVPLPSNCNEIANEVNRSKARKHVEHPAHLQGRRQDLLLQDHPRQYDNELQEAHSHLDHTASPGLDSCQRGIPRKPG